jgi:hypothetical protein
MTETNPSGRNAGMSERQAHAEAVYERLFGPRDAFSCVARQLDA